jgi:hypothetical protein
MAVPVNALLPISRRDVKKSPCCPRCGQVIPPTGVFSNARIKRRIYEYVTRHPEGVNRRQIFDAVYGDDPDGGPENFNVISVHAKEMNKTLAKLGVRLASSGGPFSVYRLVAL